MEIGDRIIQHYGPFSSTWEVTEVVDAGAKLKYIDGTAEFIGFAETVAAPNGKQLTDTRFQDFLGRAHFHSARRA